MANIYDIRRYGKLTFLLTAATVAVIFLYVSNRLVDDLAAQERERMEIWADATKEIINQFNAEFSADNDELTQVEAQDEGSNTSTLDGADPDTPPANGDVAASASGVNIDFLLKIINGNTTIPVLLTDDDGNILNFRNFNLPEPVEGFDNTDLSPANRAFLEERLKALSNGPNVIHITLSPTESQHLYYEDSTILKRLSYFPYVQLGVMIIFLVVVYFAVLTTKKAEQNKVWVGLSKETAHQLGTPISSLMGWLEVLPEYGVDPATIAEMNKDVQRLGTIASRFSKIGSKPQMEAVNLAQIVQQATGYMATRISNSIALSTDIKYANLDVKACAPLFEWVMENLIKNAVDAIPQSRNGQKPGKINVTCGMAADGKAYIEVEDNGKGIPRKNHKNVFNPGFTTKKRGWGLGLTLAKRIIEQYHGGKIFVKQSTPGISTTFRIELPVENNNEPPPEFTVG